MRGRIRAGRMYVALEPKSWYPDDIDWSKPFTVLKIHCAVDQLEEYDILIGDVRLPHAGFDVKDVREVKL